MKKRPLTVRHMSAFQAMLDYMQMRLAFHPEHGQLRYFIEMSAAVAKEERRRMSAAQRRGQD